MSIKQRKSQGCFKRRMDHALARSRHSLALSGQLKTTTRSPSRSTPQHRPPKESGGTSQQRPPLRRRATAFCHTPQPPPPRPSQTKFRHHIRHTGANWLNLRLLRRNTALAVRLSSQRCPTTTTSSPPAAIQQPPLQRRATVNGSRTCPCVSLPTVCRLYASPTSSCRMHVKHRKC